MPNFMPPQKNTAPVPEPTLPDTLVDTLAEPRAGGNYLRDPVTGVLSLNPDHEIAQE